MGLIRRRKRNATGVCGEPFRGVTMDGKTFACNLPEHIGNDHEHTSDRAEIRWTPKPGGGSYVARMRIYGNPGR